MQDRTYFVKDISDGNDVAIVTSSFYLNCFPYRHTEFMGLMREENSEVKHNFTMLCLKWFKALAKVDYYDDRNEDSVFFARTLSAHISDEMIVFNKLDRSDVPQQMECGWSTDTDMQLLIKNHLIMADDFDPFINHMLYAHKTLQQNFSRFCLDWFDTVCENEKGCKAYIQLAKIANKHKTSLRYI